MVSRKDSNAQRLKRHARVRGKISGTAETPRLCVYRSNANISAQIIEDGKQGVIRITLKYVGKQKVIHGLRRVSKPGLRIYSNCEDMPKVMNGLGIAIVSTSKGIMTDRQARKENVGGEVLAFVW